MLKPIQTSFHITLNEDFPSAVFLVTLILPAFANHWILFLFTFHTSYC